MGADNLAHGIVEFLKQTPKVLTIIYFSFGEQENIVGEK